MKARLDWKIIEYNTFEKYCWKDKNWKDLYEGDNVRKYQEWIKWVKHLFKDNISWLESQDWFTILINSNLWEWYEWYWNYETCSATWREWDPINEDEYKEREFYIPNEDE